MRPIDFEGANRYFNKPTTMDDSECLPISAYAGEDEKGMPYINTVWMPSREDIDAINSGRGIIVSICGNTLPPLSLFTLDADNQPNF